MNRIFLCILLAFYSMTAFAAETVDRRPALRLEVSATAAVTEDIAHATLFVERQHANPITAQQEVNRVLSAALAKAKASTGVQVKTGSAHTQANHGKDGLIVAWTVRNEVILESTKSEKLSQLVTELSETMSISSLGFSLSDAARKKIQTALQAEAIAAFKQKAQKATEQFGFSRYTIESAQISGDNSYSGLRQKAYAMKGGLAEAAPVSMEAGETSVSVSVSGVVRMAN
jgi:predicted secreted protein